MFSYADIQELKAKARDVKLAITGFDNLSTKPGNPDHGLATLAEIVSQLCEYVGELRSKVFE